MIASPCDGRVIAVAEDDALLIRIFLALWDKHTVCSPMACRVASIERKAGRYRAAMNPKAVTDNAQAVLTLEGIGSHEGVTIEFRMIAGLIARGIGVDVKEGEELRPGQRIGVFRLGSCVQMVVSGGAFEARVKRGQRVSTGQELA